MANGFGEQSMFIHHTSKVVVTKVVNDDYAVVQVDIYGKEDAYGSRPRLTLHVFGEDSEEGSPEVLVYD
jgi:hypothetical protein